MRAEETAAWVRRMQMGDETAFDSLFAVYQQKAVRTAALITGDVSLAEDITQEAFVICLLRMNCLREPERFQSWFFRILTRCAWKAMEKRARHSMGWGEEMEVLIPPVFDCYPSEKKAEYEKLYLALEGLGKKQRTTVILYYFNDLSIKEIAHITASLETTVKTRLFAAKKRLRQALQEPENAGVKKGELFYEKGKF